MKSTTFRKWSWVHTWSSLLCTMFLLVVCVTGLPLVFKDEIVDFFDDGIPASEMPASTPNLSLDRFALASRSMYPGQALVFPGGSSIGTPFHYLVWAHGSEPLTSHLVIPALVNARTGQLDAVATMPWFLQALQISRPLHFGDYGGTPLKIIWVLLDLTAIIMLVSGLYLWFARRARRAVP